jgi:hypothetical protein
MRRNQGKSLASARRDSIRTATIASNARRPAASPPLEALELDAVRPDSEQPHGSLLYQSESSSSDIGFRRRAGTFIFPYIYPIFSHTPKAKASACCALS